MYQAVGDDAVRYSTGLIIEQDKLFLRIQRVCFAKKKAMKRLEEDLKADSANLRDCWYQKHSRRYCV
jgi:hypothetical protein